MFAGESTKVTVPTPTKYVLSLFPNGKMKYRMEKFDACIKSHKYAHRWPFPVMIYANIADTIDFDNAPEIISETCSFNAPLLGMAFATSYGFSQRMKKLKEDGWYNQGPDIQRGCFNFAMKSSGQSSQVRVALNFSGIPYLWVSKMEGKDDDKFDMLLNIAATLNN